MGWAGLANYLVVPHYKCTLKYNLLKKPEPANGRLRHSLSVLIVSITLS